MPAAPGRLCGGLVVALFMLLSACASPAFSPVSANGIVISDAWAGETGGGGAVGVPNGAAYLTLQNNGTAAARLVSVSSDAADAVEMHETRQVNGLNAMFPLKDGIVLTPQAKVEMKVGGTHLMLVGLKRNLTAGERVNLTLIFEPDARVTLSVPIRAR